MFSFVSEVFPLVGDHNLGKMPEDYTGIIDEDPLVDEDSRRRACIEPLATYYRRPPISMTQRRDVWARTDAETLLYASVSAAVAAIVPHRRRRAEGCSRSRSGDRGEGDEHVQRLTCIPVYLASSKKRRPRREVKITGVVVDPGSLKRNPQHPSSDIPGGQNRRSAFLDELTEALAELPSTPTTTTRGTLATLPKTNFWFTTSYRYAHPERSHHG